MTGCGCRRVTRALPRLTPIGIDSARKNREKDGIYPEFRVRSELFWSRLVAKSKCQPHRESRCVQTGTITVFTFHPDDVRMISSFRQNDLSLAKEHEIKHEKGTFVIWATSRIYWTNHSSSSRGFKRPAISLAPASACDWSIPWNFLVSESQAEVQIFEKKNSINSPFRRFVSFVNGQFMILRAHKGWLFFCDSSSLLRRT